MLNEEGKELAKNAAKEPVEPVEHRAVSLWLATISDFLKLVLPEGSAIFAEFQIIREKGTAIKEAYQKEEVQDLVVNVSHILSKARQVNFIKPLDSGSSESQELEREMRLIINEFYFRWPLFYVPIIVLLGAIGFALLGVIQIKDMKINVREIAVDSQKKIETQTSEIKIQLNELGNQAKNIIDKFKIETSNRLNDDLNSYVALEKTRATNMVNGIEEDTHRRINGEIDHYIESEKTYMSNSANSYIDTIKRDIKPEWNKELARVTVQVAGVEYQAKAVQDKIVDIERMVEPQVNNIQNRLINLEKQAESLELVIREINSDANHSLLQNVKTVWTLSPFFIGGIIASVIALLLSVFALFRVK